MADTIKCLCSNCGAKYRLPVEAQGRRARCKKCGESFEVPRGQSLEDSILTWLDESDAQEEPVAQPRVISMPQQAQASEAVARKSRGPIRLKSGAGESK